MMRRLQILLLLLGITSSVSALADDVDLIIQGGTVVTMDGENRVLEGGSVAITGTKIVGVYSAAEALPAAKQVIDSRGHLVIPGLINAHGHVPMTVLRGLADDLALLEWLEGYIFPAESRNVSRDFVYWGTLLGAVEMLRGGTTTFADMYYFEEEIARATEEVGIRGVLGQVIIGFPVPDYATPKKALAGTEKFLQRYRNHPLIVPSVAPHALYTTSLEVVAEAYRLAERYDVPFQIHAAEPREENERVAALVGRPTIAALDEAGLLSPRTILHHAIWLSDEDIARIAKSGAGVTHNPESNMKLAAGLAPVTDLLAAGIPVGLGTDGAASNNNLDLFEEMDSAAKIHKLFRKDPRTLPARTVFHMATLGSAKVLGLDHKIGSLEPGKLADVVLIDIEHPSLVPMYNVFSHLVYAIKAAHVETVIVNGRVVVRDGKVLTVDEREVLRQAKRLQVGVLKSLSAQK